MNIHSTTSVLEAIQQAAFNSTYSVAQLADLLGIAPSTLYERLNPFTEDKHLSVSHLLRILDNTGPEPALRAIVQRYGFELVPMDATPDQATIEAECLDDYPSLSKAHEAYRDGDITAGHAHMANHIHECRQTMASADVSGRGQVFKGGEWHEVKQ